MIALAFYLLVGILILMVPVVLVARYFEWRAWDTDRRIARLRDRRKMNAQLQARTLR